MKLLHTADWHVGRALMNVSRQPDIAAAVEEVVELARSERPDLIVHCGDLFDSLRPAYADMDWTLDRLRELAEVCPVVVIAGNHDSTALFELFGKLLGESRLCFVARARPPAEGGILEFHCGAGEIARLAPLPFVHANRTIESFESPENWMADYADRVQAIVDALARGLLDGYDPARHVLLFAAHLFVSGARFSSSERPIHVTDTYATRSERLPPVAYAAYGHLHRPQPLPGVAVGRYAGSLVPLDFGELDEVKEIVIVEAEPGRPARISPRPLRSGRRLRRITASLAELETLAPEIGDDLCLVTVRTESPIPDLSLRVAELLPRATLLDVREDCAASRVRVVSEARAHEAEPGFERLFEEYLGAQGVRAGSANRVLETFTALLREVEHEEEARMLELEALEG